jgi:diguanylate cyclase (GGDEF)-like protein
MFLKKQWRLRTHLSLLAIAILLPAAVLVGWNAYSQFRQAEDAAAREAYNLAQITSDNTQLFLSDAERLLKALVERIQSRPSANGVCDPLFDEFKHLFPRFANLSQSSPDGYIVCSSLPQRDNKRTFVGDTEWFKRVYQQNKFIIAPPYKGVVSGRMVSVLAYPIRDAAGKTIGALQLPIDLVNLELMPGTSKFPDSIITTIFDSDGVLVARSHVPEQFIGKNLRDVEAVKLLLTIRDGTAKAVNSQGIERIYGFRPIPGTDWFASAGIATNEALKTSRAIARQNAILGAVGLVFAAFIAFFVGKKISHPIARMQTTAARVANGEYEQRASLEGPKEIADVAGQFNAMLDAIEQSRAAQAARESEIHRLAFYDVLTGLPNRRLLIQRIEELSTTARRTEQIGAVMYIDLDHFKNVNDAHGHLTGDLFLKVVADRISAILKGDDALARIGGDEFVYVATALGRNQEEAAAAALRLGATIQSALQQPFDTDGRRSIASASVGITLFPKIGDTSESLLHEADLAMYRVKQNGRNHVMLFEVSMRHERTERLAMEVDLRNAMADGQLQLYIQPQVDNAGAVSGAEALLRWNHPKRGAVSPALFIPLAEQSNLIVQIGQWVLNQGCMAQVAIQAVYPGLPVSINVSPRQFRHPGFVDDVRNAIDRAGADPARLILEVTEGLLIEDIEGTIERMNQLAAMGVRFSIDDFGTGYSSLAYLKRLPLYELKIDRSFIRETPCDPNDTAIVQSILGVAGHLGLHVVAEGVETRAQAEFLAASGCNAMQGHLFARPMPLKDWLKHNGAKYAAKLSARI